MKKPLAISLALIALVAFAPDTEAVINISGSVLCDANTNGTIDGNDIGTPNVLLVITNENNTFSNATLTASDGSYTLQIPDFDPLAGRKDPLSQIYVETITSDTLPAGSTVLIPLPLTFVSPTPAYYVNPGFSNVTYVSGSDPTGTVTTVPNWLISNPACQGATSCDCSLSGHGFSGADSKHPDHVFGGHVLLPKSGNAKNRGTWSDTDRVAKLQFSGTVLQTVDCGPLNDGSGGHTIEFSGHGKLKGHGKNKTNAKDLSFIAVVEDRGKTGDAYYLRVFAGDGTTVLLVSGDQANPENIVPVPISKGDLKIRSKNCP